VEKRVDGEGLGVRADHAGNDGWSSTSGAFGAALASLAEKYGGGDDETRQAAKTRAPRIARSSVLRSKDTSRYSARDMRAILGQPADPAPKEKRRDDATEPRRKKRPADDRPETVGKKKAKKKAGASAAKKVKR